MADAYKIRPKAAIAAKARDLSAVSLEKAEKTVEALADKNGDRFVADVLSQMSAVQVAAMLRQKDYSAPSILIWLLTPVLAAEVLKVAPLFWENVHPQMDLDEISAIRDEALDLIAALVLFQKQMGRQKAILQAIADDEASLFYLYLPFYGWQPDETYDPFFENRDVEYGSPAQLFEKMRFVVPEIAAMVFDYITTADIPLKSHVLDLWKNALVGIDTCKKIDRVAEIMFEPIKWRSHGR